MQGPFRGVASSLARAFGGKVTVHYGTVAAMDVQAIFRIEPRLEPAANGAFMEAPVPILRTSRAIMDGLSEGDLIDPKDGHIYQFLFSEESPSPASDALVSAQLEKIS